MAETEKDNRMLLIQMTQALGLSVRFNHDTGLSLHQHLGDFECEEQAMLFIEKNFQDELEEFERD